MSIRSAQSWDGGIFCLRQGGDSVLLCGVVVGTK